MEISAFRCLNPGHFLSFSPSSPLPLSFLQVENCQFISVNTHHFPTNVMSRLKGALIMVRSLQRRSHSIEQPLMRYGSKLLTPQKSNRDH